MIELFMIAVVLLLVGLYVYITVKDTQRLKEIPMATEQKLTEHNSWNLPAIDERGTHSLVILNRHFNYDDMVPLTSGTEIADEAIRRGYSFTLKGFEGKVFVKLRRAVPTEFGSVELACERTSQSVPVEYTYAYVIEEINK